MSKWTRALPVYLARATKPSIQNSRDLIPKIIQTSINWPFWPMWLPTHANTTPGARRVASQTKDNTELRIEYEKILDRVRQARESIIKMDDRRFTAPVEEISGTVDEASPGGITLKEYPGRRFQFSSVGLTAADMSARILGENSKMTRSLRHAAHTKPRAPARKPRPPLSRHDHRKGRCYLRDAVRGDRPVLAQYRCSCFCHGRCEDPGIITSSLDTLSNLLGI